MEDTVEGEYRQLGFSAADVRIPIRIGGGGKSRREVAFQGLLLRVALPTGVQGRLAFERKLRMLGPNFGAEQDDIELGDLAFDKRFHVFADKADLAGRHLTPEARRRMIALDHLAGQRWTAAVLADREAHIAVTGMDRFETGGIFTKAVDLGQLKGLLHDFTVLLTALDAVAEMAHPVRSGDAAFRAEPS